MEVKVSRLPDKNSRLKKRLGRGLDAHSKAYAGPHRLRPLNIEARDGNGKFLGGLVAESFWGAMFIKLLWVADGYRKMNIGSALMGRAEAEARKRKCRLCCLDTFNFQAPRFYAKLGYREFGSLRGFPGGLSRHYMFKLLR